MCPALFVKITFQVSSFPTFQLSRFPETTDIPLKGYMQESTPEKISLHFMKQTGVTFWMTESRVVVDLGP
jgi:hypothetical protein